VGVEVLARNQPQDPPVKIRAVDRRGTQPERVQIWLGALTTAVPFQPAGVAEVGLRGDQQFTLDHQGVETHLGRQVVELNQAFAALTALLQEPEQLVPDGGLVAELRQLLHLPLDVLRRAARCVTVPIRKVTGERNAPVSLVRIHLMHRSFMHGRQCRLGGCGRTAGVISL
jgi:hypothetical protein